MKRFKKIALTMLPAILFLCSSSLSPTVHAEGSVTEINNWSDLWNAANDPTIKEMRLN